MIRYLTHLQLAILALAAPVLLFPTRVPVVTAVAAIAIAVVLILRWRIEGPPPITPLNGALVIWLAMVAIGATVSAFPEVTLPKLAGILLGAVTWLTIVQTVLTPRHSDIVRWIFGLLGVAIAVGGVLTTNWPSKVPGLESLVARFPEGVVSLPSAPAVGVHANQLGGALGPYVPVVVSLLIGAVGGAGGTGHMPRVTSDESRVMGQGSQVGAHPAHDSRLKTEGQTAVQTPSHPSARSWVPITGLGLAALGIAALLVLTQSRSAWIGGVVSAALVVALWAYRLSPGRLRTILIVVLATGLASALGAAVWFGPSGLARLLDEPAQLEALGGTNTIAFRFEVWRWAIMAAQDFLFTGCGLGAFREVGRLLYPMNIAASYDFAHAHNIFLQVALDTGVPGLIAYLALVGLAFRGCLRAAVSRPGAASSQATDLAWSIGLAGALVALHVFGLTDAIAPGAKPGIVLWVILGLSAVPRSTVDLGQG